MINKIIPYLYRILYNKKIKHHWQYKGHRITWISNYDKDENLLEEPITRFLYQLTDDHLNNIVKYYKRHNKKAPLFIKNEIIFRKAYPLFKVEENES